MSFEFSELIMDVSLGFGVGCYFSELVVVSVNCISHIIYQFSLLDVYNNIIVHP